MKIHIRFAALLGIVFVAGPAFAQDPAANADPTTVETASVPAAEAAAPVGDDASVEEVLVLEEIIVTAQRRDQSLQDVPVSVTAFSADELELRNVTDAADLLSLTPNVSFTEDGQVGSRGVNIAIRGVNDLKSGENSVINSIGVYLDEFSVVSVASGTINPQLQDLERVEVLRGPQGTYFGRNSVGGALNLTTRKPTSEREGRLTFGGDLYDHAGEMAHVGGVLNLPISEDFRVRAAAYFETSSGLVENIQPDAAEDSGHEYSNLRLSARWLASEGTLVDVMVMHTDENQGTDETVPSGVWDIDTVDTFELGVEGSLLSPPDPGTGFWPENRNRLSHDLDEKNENTTTVAVVNLRHRLADRSVLKLIGGVIDTASDRLFDNDLIGGADLVNRENAYRGTSWSVEARLENSLDRLDWVAGALYARDDQKQSNRIRIGAGAATPIDGVVLLPPPFVFPPGLCLQCNDKRFEVDSTALFGDLTFRLSQRLDLSLGGRYTHDRVTTSIAGATSLAPGLPFTNSLRADASNRETFDDFSPRLSARYRLADDLSVYGVISKGYKGGGTSIGHDTNAPGQPAIIVPFAEEQLWSYEVGFKSELFGNRLRLNAAAFYLDWSDLQLESFRFLTSGDLSSNFEQTINIDRAKAGGFELEVTARATDKLSLTGGLGYVDTEIDCACTAELSGGFVVDLEGEPIPKSPELTANLAAEYRWPVAGGVAYTLAELIHRDGQYSDIEALTWRQTRGRFTPNSGGTAFVPESSDGFPFRTPDYDVVNLRVGFLKGKWETTVYAENLFDEEYFTGTQENFGLTGIRLRPHPRAIGTGLSYHF